MMVRARCVFWEHGISYCHRGNRRCDSCDLHLKIAGGKSLFGLSYDFPMY